MHHLMGTQEIARELGVTDERVRQLAATDPDFPAPDANLASGRVWDSAKIATYKAGRRDRRRKAPAVAE